MFVKTKQTNLELSFIIIIIISISIINNWELNNYIKLKSDKQRLIYDLYTSNTQIHILQASRS